MHRRNGSSVLDHSLLVVFYSIYDASSDHTGRRGKRSKKGPHDGPANNQAAPRADADVYDLTAAVTTPIHRFGFLLAMQILLTAGMEYTDFAEYVHSKSYKSFKNKLNGWKVWYEYCEDQHVTVTDLVEGRSEYILANFATVTKKRNVSPYKLLLGKTCAVFLLEQLKQQKELGRDRMVMDFIASVPRTQKAKKKFRAIWDSAILLD
jgi:hypothetical protein